MKSLKNIVCGFGLLALVSAPVLADDSAAHPNTDPNHPTAGSNTAPAGEMGASTETKTEQKVSKKTKKAPKATKKTTTESVEPAPAGSN